ncbi:MAG: ABC transporter permease [Chroococcidiopsidaceae cyanobacterium CP_BM_ER_R8_30]|nr:ABC transporter permease [Chroococcidiopsidaceae cyanobacterium CP_BM_ER_R8_30]
MKRILAQCSKELAQFRRDRLTLSLAFLLPFATLILFSFGVRLESKNINLVIQDFDQTPLSRAYSERFFATTQFDATLWSGSNPARDAIDRGLAKVAIVIPPHFERRINASSSSNVQVLVDGTDVNNARVIANSIVSTTNFFLTNQGLNTSTAKVTADVRLWFNPGRQESLYVVPGVYAVILWIYPSLLAAIAMVREKEQGTIVQVYASSLSAIELTLGKALAYLLIGLLEAVLIVVFGSLIFGLWFAGDPTPFLVGTLVFLLTSVMFGIQIGAVSKEQSVAVQIVSTVGFLTALLLSGFLYPLSNIPFPLSLICYIVPARYYIDISRDAFVQGTGWSGVWAAPIMLGLLCLILFRGTLKTLSRMQLSE